MGVFVGSDVTRDTSVSCDVCIVGSGAGGAVLAARLSAAGKKVVLLEDGGFHTSDRFDMTERNMFPRLYQELGARATTDQSMMIVQGRAVGGTTVVNWTTCFRTPKRVMDHWREHCGVEGLTREALEPHWARIEERLGVVKMRLEQVNRNNQMTWNGLGDLGWHRDLLSRNVRNCAHTGYCGMGCPIDAKQSMLVTMIPDAVKAGADVYANAWVERVTRDGRKCTSVVARVRDPNSDRKTGVTLTVSAKVTVLSGGAINTPAILLRSGIDPSGRTGKRTFLHPAIGIIGIHADRIEPFVGSPQYVYSDQFVERGEKQMSFLVEGAPAFPMVTGGFSNALGAERHALMELLPHASLTGILLHDGFDLENANEGATVTLKANGHPQIEYPWTPRLKEALRAAARAGMEIQLAAGAKQVVSPTGRYARTKDELDHAVDPALFEPGRALVFVAHCMGGCAMGKDPTKSVVDSRTLRHHDLDNLFVVDGSVYPTSLTVNPQISIYGLASWASEHVGAAVG
jgi:choline dehydrogenase-like flavoprotein